MADLLRGDYKQSEYGRVILPLTVLRRLDCVLEPTKDAVLARHDQLKQLGVSNMDPVLRKVARLSFYNTSEMSFRKLLGDQDHVALNLRAYIGGFSPGASVWHRRHAHRGAGAYPGAQPARAGCRVRIRQTRQTSRPC